MVCCVSLGLLLACRVDDRVEDLGTRAVVIGIDGADWKVIDALAEQGYLPNLTRLRSRGVWGEIETLHDIPLSPVIWTSVATGKTADEHGISWFMVDQPDGTRVPVRSTNRRVKAIWNILAEEKRRATVLGWWATYPAEDVGPGVVVSDGLGFHGFGSTARGGDDGRKTHPPTLFDEVSLLMPPEQQITAEFAQRFIGIEPDRYRQVMYSPARDARHDPLNPIHLFQQYAVTALGYTAIAEELLERPYDLFMVYYEQVDSFSHLFMKYAPPRLDWIEERPYQRFKDVVSEWYKQQDRLLGRLLAKVDLETTAVFVLSDHGFKSGERRIRSEEVVDARRAHLDHEPFGIFLAAGPHIRGGVEVEGASVLDVTPTVLHYLGFPVAQDMVGKVVEQVYEPEFLERHPIRYVATYESPEEKQRPTEIEHADDAQVARNLEALETLGYLSSSSGDRSDRSSDDVAVEGEESSPEVHNNLGRVHLAKGAIDSARAEFEKALELDPKNADALLNLSSILRAEGRGLQAEQMVERALQFDPNSIGALTQLAEIKRDQGELDEAIRLFGEALNIGDGLPFLYLGLGDVLQRSGRLDEALTAFRSALELDPDSYKARYNLGVTLGNQGKVEAAIVEYEKALELAPSTLEGAMSHNNLGAIHLDRGELEPAAARFRQAAALAPAHLESRYNLGIIYLDQGRVEEAVALFEAAARLQPNHELVNLRLGVAYMALGRNEDAHRSLLLVRRLYPQNWGAALYLALLFARAERPDEARPLLIEALELGGEAAREQAGSFPLLARLL